MHTACPDNIMVLGAIFYGGVIIMTIDKINDTRLIIALEDKDMQAFDLRFDQFLWSDSKSRHVIKELLLIAKEKTGFSANDKRLMIETLKRDNGCLILFTLLSEKSKKTRKMFKIKIKNDPLIYKFPDTESLLCAIERITLSKKKIKESCVLEYKKSYYLVVAADEGLSVNESAILSEYAKLTGNSSLAVAKLKEHGRVICEKSAIETIGGYLH